MKNTFIKILALALISVPAVAQTQGEILNDWAGNGRYSGSNAALTKAPKAVFYGDSITDAWYSDHVGDIPFFEENNFAGRGFSGQTTFEMLIRFRQDVINLHPKYVVILAGTNDIAENIGPIDPRVTAGNIQSMCELARANKIKPILCSILPTSRYPWRPEVDAVSKVAELNAMLEEYAKKAHIPYVDYYEAMKDGNCGLTKEHSFDGVHPTREGYKFMESIVLPYLK